MSRGSKVTVSALAACLALLACGSSSGGSSFAQDQYANCFNAGAPGDCTGCLDISCAMELGDFEKGCSGFLMCACPGGNFDSAAATSATCEAQITGNSTCESASQTMTSCMKSKCASTCGS